MAKVLLAALCILLFLTTLSETEQSSDGDCDVLLKQQDFKGATQCLEVKLARLERSEAFAGSSRRLGDTYMKLGASLMYGGEISQQERARIMLQKATILSPTVHDAYMMLGKSLEATKAWPEAADAFCGASRVGGGYAAHAHCGMAHTHIGNMKKAELAYRKALKVQPGDTAVSDRLARLYRDLGRSKKAIEVYNKAMKRSASGRLSRGLAKLYFDLGLHHQAVKMFNQALDAGDSGNDCECYIGVARCHDELMRGSKISVDSVERAQRKCSTKSGLLHSVSGMIFMNAGKPQQAMQQYRAASKLEPRQGGHYAGLARALRELGNAPQALKAFSRAIARNYSTDLQTFYNAYASTLIDAKEAWEVDAYRTFVPRVISVVEHQLLIKNKSSLTPWQGLLLPISAELQLRLAESHGLSASSSDVVPFVHNDISFGRKRVKIGFLSSDFRSHTVCERLKGVFVHMFDQSTSEAFAVATQSDMSPCNAAVREVFGPGYVDVHDLGPHGTASKINHLGIRVLFDLNGWTSGASVDVLSWRPSPIQASWFGYASSVGTPAAVDYFLGDAVATPPEHASHFTEHLLLAYDGMFVTDYTVDVPEEMPSDDVFTIASYHRVTKVSADDYDLWLSILQAVDASELWISKFGNFSNVTARNMVDYGERGGVERRRVKFVGPFDDADHVVQKARAHIHVDVANYGAHGTAADVLLAGVPHVTVPGQRMSDRVGVSLLSRCGLAHLATRTRDDFRALIVRLGRHPKRYHTVRKEVHSQVATCVAFNSSAWGKGFMRMWKMLVDMHNIQFRGHIVGSM